VQRASRPKDPGRRPPGFFRINCWRQLAENVTETLGKGARAIVIGRLRMRSWETDEGERRSLVEVEADEVAPSLKFAHRHRQADQRQGGRRRCQQERPVHRRAAVLAPGRSEVGTARTVPASRIWKVSP
jgi:single stranded DNA-binding protein